MWKVGDKVRLIEYGVIDCDTDNGFDIGNIYTINKVTEVDYEDENEVQDGFKYRIDKDGEDWWIEPMCFELVKKKKKVLKTEVDYLNAFRENFKSGI